MKLGVISDIHGNYIALQLCLSLINEIKCDAIICLGDIVGYYPNAEACMDLISNNNIHCLMGNHEAMLLGLLDIPEQKEDVYRLKELKRTLSRNRLKALASRMPVFCMNACGQRILFVHGSPWNPLNGYVYYDTDIDGINLLGYDVIFCGHTHRPFIRQEQQSTLINVGSCGLPRDNGSLCSLAIYDCSNHEASIYRIPMNIATIKEEYPEVHQTILNCLKRKDNAFGIVVNERGKKMKPLAVMVTGIGGGGHGEQILKALKMAPTRYCIVGGDMNPLSKGLKEVDYPYILPPAGSPDYIDVLLQICKKHAVKALFHGSEPELKAFSKNRAIIEQEGIFLPINPPHVIDLCMNKFKTYEWLKKNLFPVPKTIIISSLDELNKIDFFPCVLKPYINGGGSNNLFLAQNNTELLNIGAYLFESMGSFIAQEYIGDTQSEYTVGVLSDMNGILLNSIAVNRMILSGLSNRIKVKNKTGLDKYGEYLAISSGVSQGQIGKFPLITSICEDISQKMGCRGPVNIQCRVEGNKVFVFEINPRFSGTTSLRAMVGYNEPDILIRKHLLGENIKPHFEYKAGYIVRGLSEVELDPGSIPGAFK